MLLPRPPPSRGGFGQKSPEVFYPRLLDACRKPTTVAAKFRVIKKKVMIRKKVENGVGKSSLGTTYAYTMNQLIMDSLFRSDAFTRISGYFQKLQVLLRHSLCVL